ncbi:hypothetical protein ACFFWC_23445 [Plantactinospora siamensis]|uniref:Secreted protein n=1 Tax=Plantactinospora siamensis TaxID=555372 RepID=A0ABV6NUF3_9ACTN
MLGKRLFAAGTALVVGLALTATPSAAQARPNCDVPDPPPICFPGGDQGGAPTGTAQFDQSGAFFTDQIGAVEVSGHADDPDGGPVTVDVKVDGVLSATLVANGYWPTGNDVYSGTVKIPVGTPTVCAIARNYGGGTAVTLGCYVAHGPVGKLESAVSGSTTTLTGWVIDPDTTGPVTMRIDAMSGTSHTYTYYTAGLPRADIGNTYPSYGPNHGFAVTYTRPAGTCLEFDALNVGTGVDSPAWTDCLQ